MTDLHMDEYNALAYRRRIVIALREEIVSNYLAVDQETPGKDLVCEEVINKHAVVPPAAYMLVAHELELESERLRVQMDKYRFMPVGKDRYELLNSSPPEKKEESKESTRSWQPNQPRGKKRR